MKSPREVLESQKAEYDEKLRGLKAYAKELTDMTKKHGTDGALYDDDLKKAAHDAQFYEAELARICREVVGATDDLTFRVYKDAAGEWRWNLRAANNRTLADSGEGYHNKEDCLHAISLVKHCDNAPVEEKQ